MRWPAKENLSGEWLSAPDGPAVMGRWTIATVTGFVVDMLAAIILSYLVVNPPGPCSTIRSASE